MNRRPGQARNDKLVFHVAILITALASPAAIIVTLMRIVIIVERKRIGKIGIRIVILVIVCVRIITIRIQSIQILFRRRSIPIIIIR
jgi:hypothetical protein